MGVFSEMDATRQHDDNPFTEDAPLPAFTEQEPPAWSESASVPPISEDVNRRPEEVVHEIMNRLNQAPDDGATTLQDSGKVPDEDSESNENADEDAKRRAHEAAEAQRKAEWDARQQEKKAAMQAQLERLSTMSDDDVMMASMKRVSTDTEKITRRNMKDCVSEFIQTKCLEDPGFARRVMHPRKSMVHCFQYINRKASDYIQDELKANGITPGTGQNMYGSDIPDDLCYQWAVDYFNDPDAKEDQEKEEEFVPKPYISKTSVSKAKSKPKAKKDTPAKKVETPKIKSRKPAESDQIALGGFSMPEEKAG